MESQLNDIEVGNVSNAVSLRFNKKAGQFEGLIKGNGSRTLFDVRLVQDNGTLIARLVPTGKKRVKHVIILDKVDGGGKVAKSTGGKMPHFSGKGNGTSFALWQSEYSPETCFVIFTDVDEEAVAGANDFFAAVDTDDESVEQAKTFFDTADGKTGRPDTSEDADVVALKDMKALNG